MERQQWSLIGVRIDTENVNSTLKSKQNRTITRKEMANISDMKCEPIQNIMFLKVHKCASSTISSMLLRYAVKHDLNVALPPHDFGHLGWPRSLEKRHILQQNEMEKAKLPINIIAHHTTYNRQSVQSLMPGGTKLVAILRRPLSQLRSSLNFFRVASSLGLTDFDALSEFLNSPDVFETRLKFVFNDTNYGERSITKNFMSTEFGLVDEFLEDKAKIAAFIQEIDQDFNLVMIKEHLYESVVLLRRILCWDLGDLLFRLLNRKKYQIEFYEDRSLLQKHKSWSPVDYALYEHFNKTLWDRIGKQDSSFQAEVEYLRWMNERLNRLCYSEPGKDRFMLVRASKWNKAFTFKQDQCRDLLRMPEYWTPLLKRRQREKLKEVSDPSTDHLKSG